MRVFIRKEERTLYLFDGSAVLLRVPVALGPNPCGAKRREGDGRTPEGVYTVCLVKPNGRHGKSLGLNYPNLADARTALAKGAIDQAAYNAVADAVREGRRPPWGTALGGEIYIHGGGAQSDWTQGCVALDDRDMDVLFGYHEEITEIEIVP